MSPQREALPNLLSQLKLKKVMQTHRHKQWSGLKPGTLKKYNLFILSVQDLDWPIYRDCTK